MPGKGEASAVICHNGLFSSQAGPVSDHVAPFFVCPGALAGVTQQSGTLAGLVVDVAADCSAVDFVD